MNLSFYYSTKDFLNLTPYILLDSIVRPSYGILNFYFAVLFILLLVDDNFISLCSCECSLWRSESSLLESVLSFHHVRMRLKSGCKACQQVLYLVSKLNAPGCVWWMCYCLMSILPSKLHEKKPFLLFLLNLAHFPNTWKETKWYVPHERHEVSSVLLLYNVSFSRLNLAVVLFPCISNHASPIHHLAYLFSGTSNTELFVLVQVEHLFKLFIYILHH